MTCTLCKSKHLEDPLHLCTIEPKWALRASEGHTLESVGMESRLWSMSNISKHRADSAFVYVLVSWLAIFLHVQCYIRKPAPVWCLGWWKKALVLTACSNLVSPQTCSPGRKKVGHLTHDPTWSNIFLNLNAWHGDVWNHSETLVLHLSQVSHSLLLDCYRLCRNTLPRWKKMQHEFHATFRWNMMTRGTKTGSKYIKFWSPCWCWIMDINVATISQVSRFEMSEEHHYLPSFSMFSHFCKWCLFGEVFSPLSASGSQLQAFCSTFFAVTWPTLSAMEDADTGGTHWESD